MSQIADDDAASREAWASAPSPCVDVCKYKRAGRCVGCSMTKAEKDAFPASGGADAKQRFFATLFERLRTEHKNPAFWAIAYRRKCEREGRVCPLDFEEDEANAG